MQSDSASRRYRQSAKKDNLGNSVLFIQYLNPGAYPPLEHASDALIEANVECTFLGAHFSSTAGLDLPQKAGRRVVMHPIRPSFKPGALRYLHFLVWATVLAVRFNKRWVYCSDARSTPIGLVLGYLGRRVIYHEHDAPAQLASTFRDRIWLACRRALVRRVPCVVPSQGRAQILKDLGAQQVLIVPNCPSIQELESCAEGLADANTSIRLLYQGSIAPDRLPSTVIQAIANLPPRVRPTLDIVGYEVISGEGHVAALQEIADRLGIPQHVNYIGALPRRKMLRKGTGALVGLSLMPMTSENMNMKGMAGASNKPFDYLCQSVVPICSDLTDWREFYGDSALYCDPRSPDSISSTLREAIGDLERTRAQGRAGQSRIREQWNYDSAFAPILQIIASGDQSRPQERN